MPFISSYSCFTFLHRVTLRGQPDEDAVLCTETKTYAIKFVGTSNSVFLIPPSDNIEQKCNGKDGDNLEMASVIKVAPGCMELVEVAPKLDKLKLLLTQSPYSFAEASEMEISEEGDKTKIGFYRWSDLVNRLQASDEELLSGLHSLSAVEIGGYWRILDEDYMISVLTMLLHDIVLNDWPIDALNEDEVVNVLEKDGYPRIIAKHCFRVHATKVVDDGVGTWKLDQRRVCIHLAREILKGGKMKKDIFMEKWIRKVPDVIHVNFDMLEGEVLTERLGVETWVYAFSVSSLPSSPAERFSMLFKERPKWEWKDLQPYVWDLRVPGLSLEGLLLKYTRRSQPSMEAEPIFSAR